MPDAISPELFAHLAELAAFELDPAESEYLRAQLNNQLKAVAELEKIDVAGDVPLAAHGVPYPPEHRPPLRPDAAACDPGLVERILAQAPQTADRYFVVPEIPHTDI
jgi:aspartyl/glutamyl-tRNA(Asn/Gln) amidotransferase C subunit